MDFRTDLAVIQALSRVGLQSHGIPDVNQPLPPDANEYVQRFRKIQTLSGYAVAALETGSPSDAAGELSVIHREATRQGHLNLYDAVILANIAEAAERGLKRIPQ